MLLSQTLSQTLSSTPVRALSCSKTWHPMGWAVVGWCFLWCLSLLVPADTLAQLGWQLNEHGHAHLYAHGHPFVDARSWWGIPNTLDVLSNLPILVLGMWGLWRWPRTLRPVEASHQGEHASSAAMQMGLPIFFAGLVLTGVGSALYHAYPSGLTLVGDRLGMAVTFAAAMGMALTDRAGYRVGQLAWRAALPMAVLSSALPWAQHLVLPWVVVQFGGIALLLALFGLSSRRSLHGRAFPLLALLGWYALAKCLEAGDAWVWSVTGEWVSGHSLKHLAAAMAAWPVLRLMSHDDLPCGTMPVHQARDGLGESGRAT